MSPVGLSCIHDQTGSCNMRVQVDLLGGMGTPSHYGISSIFTALMNGGLALLGRLRTARTVRSLCRSVSLCLSLSLSPSFPFFFLSPYSFLMCLAFRSRNGFNRDREWECLVYSPSQSNQTSGELFNPATPPPLTIATITHHTT